MSDDPREQAIRERLEQITPGPWRRGPAGVLRVYGPDGNYEHAGLLANVFKRPADCEFIAHAPEDIDYLLSALSSSRSREQALRERLEQEIAAMHVEAGEADDDGDICCGQTRRYDAERVAKCLRELGEAPRVGEEEPS